MSKSENTQGSRKAPRTHNKAWADTTRAERQQKRLAALNAAARVAGWASWSAYETAVVNGMAQPTPLAPDLKRAARKSNKSSKPAVSSG